MQRGRASVPASLERNADLQKPERVERITAFIVTN
jgi:hypothetical protein